MRPNCSGFTPQITIKDSNVSEFPQVEDNRVGSENTLEEITANLTPPSSRITVHHSVYLWNVCLHRSSISRFFSLFSFFLSFFSPPWRRFPSWAEARLGSAPLGASLCCGNETAGSIIRSDGKSLCKVFCIITYQSQNSHPQILWVTKHQQLPHYCPPKSGPANDKRRGRKKKKKKEEAKKEKKQKKKNYFNEDRHVLFFSLN